MCVGGAAVSSAGALTPSSCPLPAASQEPLLEALGDRRLCGGAGGGGRLSQRPPLLAALPAPPNRPCAAQRALTVHSRPFLLAPLSVLWPLPRLRGQPGLGAAGLGGRTWLYLYCFLSGSRAAQWAPSFHATSAVCSGGLLHVLGQGIE